NRPPYENISQTSGNSFTPSVAVSNDGTVYVVWAESTGVNNFEIFFSENHGSGWSDALNISANATISVAPDVTVDGSGNVHVCWWDFIFEGPDNMALYRMRRADGTWDTIQVVAHTTTASDSVVTLPRIAAGFNDVVYIMWWGYMGESGLRYRIKADGNWSDIMVVPGLLAHNPASISVDLYGNLHIAYEGSDAIHYEMLTPGGTWQNFATITEGSQYRLRPDITIDEVGVVYVTWSMPDDEYYIYYSENSAGTWASPTKLPMQMPDDIGFESSIDIDRDGCLHFVWQNRTKDAATNQYGETDIYYVCRSSSGDWSSVHNISNTAGISIAHGGSLQVDESGNAHVVWADNELGNYEIFYLKIPKDSL
ncbi:hypothetical protein IBX73_10925, partial [candidate division WOR-3 bacterium]|nr:hypothetical protein [candidate division WOR-3 bacterium]